MEEDGRDTTPGDGGATLAPTATTLASGQHLSSDLDDSFLNRVAGLASDPAGPAAPVPEVGAVIDGKYRLESLRGRGGMGFVFAARHIASDRAVALKWMQRRGNVNELSQRFVGEARAAGRIRHPNVVDVYDVVATEELTYLVMELLEGESLRTRLTRGPMAPLEAVEVGMAVLSGLEEAHRRGVIHRDLKPENVFLCSEPEWRVKIVDFGISLVADAGLRLSSELTRTGHFVGTPSYTALERLRDNQPFDHRVDLYSVGVILYEALTGNLPFDAMSVSELTFQLATQEPTPLRRHAPVISERLAQVIERAIARSPDERFQDAAAFRSALQAAMNPVVQAGQRKASLGRLALGAALLSSMAAAGFTLSSERPEDAKAKGASAAIAAAVTDARVPVAAPVEAPAVSTATSTATASAAPAPAPAPSLSLRGSVGSRRGSLPSKIATAPAATVPAPAAPEIADATLRVVVFPYGDIWVDGVRVGTSPSRVKVAPGPHVIGGGRSSTEQQTKVDMRSGETRDVVLTWAKAEASSSEAETLRPGDAHLTGRSSELQRSGVGAQ